MLVSYRIKLSLLRMELLKERLILVLGRLKPVPLRTELLRTLFSFLQPVSGIESYFLYEVRQKYPSIFSS